MKFSEQLGKLLNKTSILGMLVAMGGGIVIGIGSRVALPTGTASVISSFENQLPLRENSSVYKYINPLLLCNASTAMQPEEFKPLQDKVDAYVSSQKKLGNISSASVYFRDLKAGRWMIVNPIEQYSPASLLKVPIMIAIFKQAESNPKFLNKTIYYDSSEDLNAMETFKPQYAIKPKQSYTVRDLLHYMIAYSDNNALRLLGQNLNQNFLNEVYNDLSLTTPSNDPNVSSMSVSDYSYFFRILYNATYLTRENSEEALKLLLEPDFSEGLKKGVPPDVEVAQKFGERTIYTDDAQTQVEEKELHDCGIVYYPSNPYLLCVMTRGTDFTQLSTVIQNITRMSYLSMSAVTRNNEQSGLVNAGSLK